jgi:hypothetical protein
MIEIKSLQIFIQGLIFRDLKKKVKTSPLKTIYNFILIFQQSTNRTLRVIIVVKLRVCSSSSQ